MISKDKMVIVDQHILADDIYEITLKGFLVSEMREPGQFVHVKITEGPEAFLRRPISISAIDKSKEQFTMIYRKDGVGTRILSEKSVHETVDVLGPLGNGFPVEQVQTGQTALLVGGGIGVPPLYELSKQLNERGVHVIHVLGFQTRSAVFYEEKFEELGTTYISTVDGSYGTKGFVTDVIEKFGIHSDALYACGPTPMLRALDEKYRGFNAYLSLEERMGCGIGACFACVCHLQADPHGHSYKKVCSDGPVFKAGEVVL